MAEHSTPEAPPPLKPMLARLVRELPEGDYLYEPKWDGFRCLAARHGPAFELHSRHGRSLARYFPELVHALAQLREDEFVLDGEIVLERDGRLDFEALMGRLHPAASRVRELAARRPAALIAFDLPALGGESLCALPFAERRTRLCALLAGARPPLHVTPATDERAVAERWLSEFRGGGLDGVTAKARELPYQPGARAMLKVKHERTADCVVAGIRGTGGAAAPGQAAPAQAEVTSLLLGLYDGAGALEHIGVASGFTRERRRALARELVAGAVPLRDHPWEHGFLVAGGAIGRLKGAAGRWLPGMTLDWLPLAPERVAEVAYTHLDGHRLRHPARFARWRPDREPRSCRLEQLESEAALPPGLLGT
ncbi:MAG TPA: ATP-dependent DNA ligase [Solirubrobacteraceae bacterium]|nr:ATP-dependent DNA ligase [Solirubrobacteraceae bacterium]